MSVVWCSVSVVWMLVLHGFKLLIISFIRRFSVVCNSILYFCVCYDAVIAWAWLQSKVCPASEWNSVCFVLFLGKADYCRRKDKKLPQRGQFCAYMRHKVIEGSVISSIITIWKPVCLLFFNLFLTIIICVCVHTFARCAHVYNNERWRKWNDKLFKTVKNETKMKLSSLKIWWFRK